MTVGDNDASFPIRCFSSTEFDDGVKVNRIASEKGVDVQEKLMGRAEKKKLKALRKEKRLNDSDRSIVPQLTLETKVVSSEIQSRFGDSAQNQKPIACDQSITTSPIKIQPQIVIGSRSQFTPKNMVVDDVKSQKKVASKLARQQVPKRKECKKKMNMFSHLFQMERYDFASSISFSTKIHSAFIKFGLQCFAGIVFHQNDRCIHLIECLRSFILDFEINPGKDFSRDMESQLSPSLSFLSQCRPLSAGMSTTIKLFKSKITDVYSLDETEAKKILVRYLETFFYERILFASEAIITITRAKILENDVILTYSYSTLISSSLIGARNDGVSFRVIIVDSKPRFDGKKTLFLLSKNGIKCTYVGVNAIGYVMPFVTKVLVDAEAIMANGAVMCPVGSAMLASLAKEFNIPFMVTCETLKFIERAQTDAFVYNELGDPDDLIKSTLHCGKMFTNWKDYKNVALLNIFHDIIDARLVTLVISELGITPSFSAPVVLKLKN